MNISAPRVKDLVNPERVVKTLVAAGSVWGPTGEEKVVADLVVDRFQKMNLPGARITVDKTGPLVQSNTGNVIVEVPATPDAPAGAPAIGLFFHMDRVPARAPGVPPTEPVKVVVEPSGDIHSQGYRTNIAADDRAGYAEIAEGLQVVAENHIPHGRVVVVGLTREEVDSGGAYQLDPEVLKGLQFGYAVDGTDIGQLTRGGCSITHWQAEVQGLAAHSGIEPKKGISALDGAARAVVHMGPLGYVSEGQTLNVSNIQGGSLEDDGTPVYNVIPDHCSVFGEFRSITPDDQRALTSRVQGAFTQAEKELGVKTSVHLETEQGFLVPEDSPAVRYGQRAMEAAGVEPHTIFLMAGSDATPLNTVKGLPTVLLGTGAQDEHTVQEHILTSDLVKGSAIIASLVQQTGDPASR